MNVIHILGNLGGDPQTRQVNDTSVTTFSVATSETYKDRNGEKMTRTEWHRVNFWGKAGEIIAQYLKKGDKIQVSGQMTYREYKVDGLTRKSAEIKGREFNFVSSSRDNRADDSHGHSTTAPASAAESDMPALEPVEDLPF